MNKFVKIISLFIFISVCGCKTAEKVGADNQLNVGVIAHRGYWKIDGSAENSISSLENAIEGRFYGSEIDVHLTKDNKVVVYHDNKIDKRIPIQESNYADIESITLDNGEKLPMLEEHLEIISKQSRTKLIIEIKPHQTPQRNREAARIVYAMVRKYKAESICEYISFDMDACRELIELNKKNKVSFLSGDAKNAPNPAVLAKDGFWGVDYSYIVFNKHPEYVKSAHDAGMKVNVWTVNEIDRMQEMIDLKVDFITTDEPVQLKELLIINTPLQRNRWN